MRVVWKDSKAKTKSGTTLEYRRHTVTAYGGGWITDMPNDDNIYFPCECALNAIDAALGGKTRKQNPQRHALGIRTIGKISTDAKPIGNGKDGERSCG